MKIKFWKHKSEVVGFILGTIAVLSCLIIILINTKHESLLFGLLMFGLISIIFILYEILNKDTLSKIIFSENGIDVTHLKKNIMHISWIEITDVKLTHRGVSLNLLTFVIGNNKIHIELNKKMYITIMALCPRENLKSLINDIECFKKYHKNK